MARAIGPIVAAYAAAAALGVGPSAPSSHQPVPDQPVANVAAVAAALEAANVEIATIQFDAAVGEPAQVLIPIAGQQYWLDLWPHSVRSADYQLLEQRADGLLYEVDPGPVNTLRGQVVGLEGSIAAGGIASDGLYLTILFPDGQQFWVQPLTGVVPGAGKDQYAIYRNGDSTATGICGTTDDQRLPGAETPPAGGSPERGLTRWTAQLATDADYEYYTRWGGTTNVASRIGIILNVVNLQYERDVDIIHTVSRSIVRTAVNDPYTATEENVMNAQITAAWTGETGTWDLIHVFTGTDRDLTGSVIGRANAIGSVCNGANSNCWSWVEFSSNFSSQTDLMAHEMGHLWDGSHCSCSDPESTMNPSISSINRFGVNPNDTAVTTIPFYRTFRPCLTNAGSTTAPPNDDCASADRIFEGTYAFNNLNATTDGPPACGSFGDDIWYLYIAPCDGTLTLDTCVGGAEPLIDTVLAAYTGGCGSLTEVACNDDNSACGGSPPRQSQIVFPVTAGTTYRIRVGGFNGINGTGILSVDQTSCPPPSNNNCGQRITVSSNTDIPFSTFGATTDGPLETNCSGFGDDTVGNDIWYRWVAQCTEMVTVSLCGSSYDTRVAIYNSCPSFNNLSIACNDDSCGLQSQVTFSATAGSDYFIRIGGYNNAVGNGTFRINACAPPPNDACAAAIDVSAGGTFNGTLVDATNDGTGSCGASASQADVWYRFTAPPALCGGTLTLTTCGTHDLGGQDSGMDTVLGLFSACGGTELACNDDAPTACGGLDEGTQRDSRIVYNIAPGESVRIRVSKFSTVTPRPFVLRVQYVPLVSDSCGGARPATFGDNPFCTTGATTDGPVEASCLFAGDNQVGSDIWFRYTATCTAPLRVTMCNATYDAKVAVYAGPCPAGPDTAIACNDDSCGLRPQVTFDAVASQRYAIRIGGYNGATGSGTMVFGLAADWNGDGVVNSNDISAYLTAWLLSIHNGTRNADFNNDNTVNSNDISAFLTAWLAAVNNC